MYHHLFLRTLLSNHLHTQSTSTSFADLIADEALKSCDEFNTPEVIDVEVVTGNSDPARAQPQAAANNGAGDPTLADDAELIYEDIFVGQVNGGAQVRY